MSTTVFSLINSKNRSQHYTAQHFLFFFGSLLSPLDLGSWTRKQSIKDIILIQIYQCIKSFFWIPVRQCSTSTFPPPDQNINCPSLSSHLCSLFMAGLHFLHYYLAVQELWTIVAQTSFCGHTQHGFSMNESRGNFVGTNHRWRLRCNFRNMCI